MLAIIKPNSVHQFTWSYEVIVGRVIVGRDVLLRGLSLNLGTVWLASVNVNAPAKQILYSHSHSNEFVWLKRASAHSFAHSWMHYTNFECKKTSHCTVKPAPQGILSEASRPTVRVFPSLNCAGTSKNPRLPMSRGCSRISSSPKSTTPTFGVLGDIAGSELARKFNLKIKRAEEHQNLWGWKVWVRLKVKKWEEKWAWGCFIGRMIGRPREVLVHWGEKGDMSAGHDDKIGPSHSRMKWRWQKKVAGN